MRPKKKLLIYHPVERTAALYRYAMDITLFLEVSIASSAASLKDRTDVDATVLWTVKQIEICNPHTKTLRELPLTTSNTDLMEAVRIGLARKCYRRQDVRKVTRVVTEIDVVERMMDIVLPRRKRFAA